MANPAQREGSQVHSQSSYAIPSDRGDTQDCRNPNGDRTSQVWTGTAQSHPFFHQGKTGNITLKQLFKQMVRSGNIDESDIGETLAQIDASLKERNLLPAAGRSKSSNSTQHTELLNVYAPRKYQNPAGVAGTPIKCTQDPKYASAKDPYDLFRIALEEAYKELGITADQLASSDFNKSPASLNAYRLAIYNVLAQANVSTDRCECPYVEFNNYLTAKYQQPIITYTPKESGETEPRVLYTRDILSTTRVGCDPEGARRLISDLKNTGFTDAFTDYLLGRTEQDNPEMLLLKELIDTMANQVRKRYGSKIAPMAARSLENKTAPQPPKLDGTSFSTYIATAETPTQVISRGIVWAAHQYISRGLINEDDMYGGDAFPHIRGLICATTAFEMINNATAVDDFRLALTGQTYIRCGKFYACEPSENDPNILKAREQFIPNELSGIGTVWDLGTDLIKAKHLMNQLTPDELSVFQNYLYAPYLVNLYRMKGVTDQTALNSDVAARVELECLSPVRQKIIRDLLSELLQIKSFIDERHFITFARDSLNTVEFPDILPTVDFNNESTSSTSTSRAGLTAMNSDQQRYLENPYKSPFKVIPSTPIHIFGDNHPQAIGGNEDGMIQPNSRLGGQFTGAPIRLLYDGIQYNTLQLKTATQTEEVQE